MEQSERLELEYDSLRGDNNFKVYPEGKKLFIQWRNGLIDNHALSKKFGVSTSTFLNLDRRLKKKAFNAEDFQKMQDRLSNKNKKHKDEVSKTRKKIKKGQKFKKDSKKDPKNDSRKGNGDYSIEDHIEQIKLSIDAEDAEDLVELAVKVHRYLFLHEFDGYEQLRKQTEMAVKYIDQNESSSIFNAKTLTEMLDKKQSSLENKIKAIIGQYGTLLSSAATEVLDEQDARIDAVGQLVLDTLMGGHGGGAISAEGNGINGTNGSNGSNGQNTLTESLLSRAVDILDGDDNLDDLEE